jgi:hypothetical protein
VGIGATKYQSEEDLVVVEDMVKRYLAESRTIIL